jgi:uncharacterized membrane protein
MTHQVLTAVARGGIALLGAVLVGIMLPGFRNQFVLVVVVAAATVFPLAISRWASWEWPHDPVTISLLLLILALVLLFIFVSPSYIGSLL